MHKKIHRGILDERKFLFFLLLSGVMLVSSCSSESTKFHSDAAALPTVAVAKVQRTDLSRALVLAAEFRPFQEVEVHAKVAGYVKKIYVDVGDRVKAGQLLATLEIPELHDEVNQAEAAVQQSQEEIRKAKSDIRRYESAYEAAHLAYTRLAGVSQSQPGLVAQQEIDEAQGRDRVGEAQVSTAQAELAAAEQQLNVAKANQQRVQAMFAYAQITAPFAGVVTKRYADTGSMIQAGTASDTQSEPVVRLSQNTLLRLVIPVPESVVPQIHLKSKVEVRVPVLGKTYQGTVSRFADQVDMATRTMHTEVDVANPSLELVPGEYAEASIVLDQERNALAVPIQALNRAGENVSVLVVNKENKIEERQVKVGIETPDQAEIISGLEENDLVVVGSRSQFRPGTMVQPKLLSGMQPSGGK
jgi:RND family efflux transporter MFP subunit